MDDIIVSEILRVLGMTEDFTWGDRRARLEEQWARCTRKFGFLAGFVFATFLCTTAGLILQVISPTVLVIVSVVVLFVMSRLLLLCLQLDRIRTERRTSKGLLRGRTPVAVAAYKIDTLPGRTLLLIRAGGAPDWSRNELVYNEAVPAFLSGIFTQGRGLKNYLLVGCWEKTRVATVHEVRLKEKEIFTWLNRRVGCPVHTLTEEWWEELEDQETPPHG